ncbi:MAG: tetratricopeptide repeat protein [Mariniphaga sp.]|nr:tetratricopeptide repeat protein [Mariniphaga sp.]
MKSFKSNFVTIIVLLLLSFQNVKNVAAQINMQHESQMVQIEKLYASQQWSEIIKLEPVLLKHAEKDLNALLILSESYAQTGNITKGNSYAEMIIAKDPSNYFAFMMLGNNSYVSKEYDQAEKYYLKVLEIRPTYARANLNLASIYEMQKKKEKAISQYFQAIELFSANNFNNEVILYSKAVLNLDPNNTKAKSYLAITTE